MTTWRCVSCDGENPEGMRFCGHCGSPMEATAPLAAAALEREPDTPEVTDALRGFVSKVVAERLEQGGGRIDQERRLVTALFADISGFTSLAERLDVEKFAGDALLALLGAPVSHEDDAERALLVAGEMHEELARLREELSYDEAREPHRP